MSKKEDVIAVELRRSLVTGMPLMMQIGSASAFEAAARVAEQRGNEARERWEAFKIEQPELTIFEEEYALRR